MKTNIHQFVEETHIGICGDGFDNILLYADVEGLEDLLQYVKVLNEIGAPKSAKAIQDLIDWISSNNNQTPLELIESDSERTNVIWQNYLDSSRDEDPERLALEKAPKQQSPRLPITDRDFYEFYGPEDISRPCRREGCERGTVNLSVLCRPHHFESTKGKPCPWKD